MKDRSKSHWAEFWEMQPSFRSAARSVLEGMGLWRELKDRTRRGEIPESAQIVFAAILPEVQPSTEDIGCYYCPVIKAGDTYYLFEGEPNYERITAEGEWGIAEEYFVFDRDEYTLIPQSIQTIASTFGDISPSAVQVLDRGSYRIRRELHLPSRKQPVHIELDFQEEDGLVFVETRLRNLQDPLALKSLYIALYQCQQNGDNWFHYYPSEIADIMGYKRDRKGYHRSANIARIESKFKILLDARYRWELPWGNEILKFEGPLLEVGQSSTESVKQGHVLARGVRIQFYEDLYQEVTKHRRFAWINNACLRWNTLKHGKAFLLYSYYSSQLSLGLSGPLPKKLYILVLC